MNTSLRVAVAAAAVLVVAMVGLQFFGTTPVGPGASPAPTASPTPAPTVQALKIGTLAPGTYALSGNGPIISLQVPAGWVSPYGDGVNKHPDTLAEIGLGRIVNPGAIYIYADACKSAGSQEPLDETVAGLVAALDAQASTDATITDVAIDGRPAKRIDLVESPGVDPATCRYGPGSPMQIWADAAEVNFYSLFGGMSGFVLALDVDGDLVVFAGEVAPDASEADIAELNAILASIDIADAPPASSP